MGQFQPPTGATPPKPNPPPPVPGVALRDHLAHDAYAPLRRRVQLYY